jgi:hypothetical protein
MHPLNCAACFITHYIPSLEKKNGGDEGRKNALISCRLSLSLSLSLPPPCNLLTVLHKILFLTFLLCIFIVVKWQNGDEVPE